MNASNEVEAMYRRFGAREDALRDGDEFVADNFAELRGADYLALGVPAELGGGGLELPALCDVLRTMGRYSSSTALAFAMHTHQVAVAAWRWRHQKAPVGPLLERVARERIALLSTGGGDWVYSSGRAERAPGGYRVTARKAFASGSLAGDLLMTSAVAGEEGKPAEVVHFAVPMKADGVRIEPTWRSLGMRNTASNDVVLEGVFVPEGAVALRRPQGKWHPLFDLLCMIALPIIYSVYVGVAEAARERALALVRRRAAVEEFVRTVGDMENELALARIAHADWVANAAQGPGRPATARALADRALVARGVLRTVEAAMEAVGGPAFYRDNGLERLFRDAQAARYHPLQDGPQRAMLGRLALEMEI